MTQRVCPNCGGRLWKTRKRDNYKRRGWKCIKCKKLYGLDKYDLFGEV